MLTKPTLPWLVRLRWGGVLVELLIIAFALTSFGPLLPIRLLVAVVLLTALSNLILAAWISRHTGPIGEDQEERAIRAILVLDVLLLTLLLALSGGPTNPFSILYFVHVAIAAVVIGRYWTWIIAVLSTGCFGLLFVFPSPIGGVHVHGNSGDYGTHLQGMWVAFALSAILVAHFLSRLTEALQAYEAERRRVERLTFQQERLAALTNLAAGAAHELATPLSTIALTARELLHAFGPVADLDVVESVHLIRSQVERCKMILQEMAGQAGDLLGEMPIATTVDDIVAELARDGFVRIPEQLEIRNHIGNQTLVVPRSGLLAALRGLIKNGLESADASAPAPLRLTVSDETERVAFVVTDYGTGIPPEVLERVGEPFFTTKEPGRGMGLGVFLARLFAERLGGSLTIRSALGIGTTVTLVIPKRS